MRLACTIAPALSPIDRGTVEDLFAERLEETLGATVDPIGGGTLLGDAPVSDFAIEVEAAGREEVTALWRQVFEGIPFTLPTTVTLAVDGGEPLTITVGGPREC